MTTGTKVFFAVFALIVGILVVYYGMANGKGTANDNSSKVAQPDTHADVPTAPLASEARRESPPPRQATPITPQVPAIDPSANASRAGGLLSEGVREASGEAPLPNAYLPLMGLNNTGAETASPNAGIAPSSGADAGESAVLPITNQPAPARTAAPAAPTLRSTAVDTAAPLRIEHIIRSGDTYTSIAQDWFGDGTKWTLIAKENPTIDPARLKVGQKIFLPPKDAALKAASHAANSPAAAAPESVPAEGELIYTVQEGDTLSSIARQHYNDPGKWKDIYDLNRKTIGPDAGALKLGMKLRLKMVKSS